jgi:hypothetical protein
MKQTMIIEWSKARVNQGCEKDEENIRSIMFIWSHAVKCILDLEF